MIKQPVRKLMEQQRRLELLNIGTDRLVDLVIRMEKENKEQYSKLGKILDDNNKIFKNFNEMDTKINTLNLEFAYIKEHQENNDKKIIELEAENINLGTKLFTYEKSNANLTVELNEWRTLYLNESGWKIKHQFNGRIE